MSLPESLNYRVTAPQGFPNTIKEVFFTPVQTTQAYQPNEVVRWEVRSNGYLDPYTTRLNFDVMVDDLSPDEIRRLDGSAHSFFSELRIQVRGVEVEIIREYDSIAQILHDINWNAADRRIKAHEGHGICDLSYGEFAWMQNSYDKASTQLKGVPQYEGYDPTDPMHSDYAGPSSNDPCAVAVPQTLSDLSNYFFTTGSDPITFTPVSITTTSGTLDGNRYQFYPIIGGTGFNVITMQDVADTVAAQSGSINRILQYQDSLPFVSSSTNEGPRGLGYQTKIQQFAKNKIRWTHSGLYQPCAVYSGYEKDLHADFASDNTQWNRFKPSTDEDNAIDMTGYSSRYLSALLQQSNFAQTRINESPFPSFWYMFADSPFTDLDLNTLLITDSVQRRNIVCSLVWQSWHGQANNYSQNVMNFLTNGYFKTLPWTLTRSDKQHVYEITAENTKTNYDRRIKKVPFYELGSNKMGFVEYDSEGYTLPYNPLYCQGADEPYFAGVWVPVHRLFKGQTQLQMGRSFMTFSVPLLSAIFGVLLPPELYKLIPMNIMEELVIELRVNPYALFSSGYRSQYVNSSKIQNEICDYRRDNVSRYQLVQNTRNFKISRIELWADLLSFTSAVDSIVMSQYQSENGIVFQTHGWALGPQTIFQNSAAVQGTHQINYSFNSLKAIFWRFQPLDFEKYSFCRKHFYITHNITRYQLQLGQDFLPIDGVRGQAGTPFGTEGDRYGSNKEFFNQMLKCFNKLHDMKGNMSINPFNWAVNERPYNVDAKGSYYSVGHVGVSRSVYQGTIVQTDRSDVSAMGTLDPVSNHGFVFVNNPHTALQLPGFHETRVVGKCLYGYNLESMRTDFTIISGLNTYAFKPFNIVFEVDGDQTKHFNRQSKILLFFWYDLLVQFKQGMAPVIVGRA